METWEEEEESKMFEVVWKATDDGEVEKYVRAWRGQEG